MSDDDITVTVEVDLSGVAEDLRTIGDALHEVADEIDEDGDADE